MKSNLIIALLAAAVALPASGQSKLKKLPKNYDDGISGKWEFRFDAGAQYGTLGDMAALVNIGGGYNFNSNLYFGIASGLYSGFGVVDWAKSAEAIVPVMGDLTVRFNMPNEKNSFFVQTRAGYLFNTTKEITLENYEVTPYTRQDYFTFEIGPGWYLRPSRNIDVRLSFNYALAVPGDDGFDPAFNHTEHLFQGRLGMNFRGTPRTKSRSELEAEATHIEREEQERLFAEMEAARKLQEQQARERAEADRAARRARREAESQQVESPAAMMGEAPIEYYFHVSPSILEGGMNNKLVELASMCAAHKLAAIVIKGYSANGSSDDATTVIEAMKQAENVKNHLVKNYVIDKNLISCVFAGFESASKKEPLPNGCIATIMIQKVQ